MAKTDSYKKTRIVCTIGPSCDSIDMIKKMHEKGMDIARLNFSHGDHEYHSRAMKNIKLINKGLDVPIGLLLDTKGPEIRIGKFEKPEILQDGQDITLTTKDIEYCSNKLVNVSYKELPKIVQKGSPIYIADGTIELKVIGVKEDKILCKVIVGGEINTKKNLNIPGASIQLPSISSKDTKDILLGIENGIDFIAQSFVKTAKDVEHLRKILKDNGGEHIHIISKIESRQALENIDEIIKASDALMIARGDLGVQIPIENIPAVQKMIIKKCNAAGKPVITATQMLESMTKNSRPTRAEATDVANAIIDGTDAVMLSAETASGNHPQRAVEMMNKICCKTEQTLKHTPEWFRESVEEFKPTITDSLSRSVCEIAAELKAAAIVSCTSTGYTAKQISRHRPMNPIIAVTPNEKEFRKLTLVWGVIPILIKHPANTDELINKAITAIKNRGMVQEFDLIVIAAGVPFSNSGKINLMKIEMI